MLLLLAGILLLVIIPSVHLLCKHAQKDLVIPALVAELLVVGIPSTFYIYAGIRKHNEVYRLEEYRVRAETALNAYRSDVMRKRYQRKITKYGKLDFPTWTQDVPFWVLKAVKEYNGQVAKCRSYYDNFFWKWAIPKKELFKYRYIFLGDRLDR
jgi:hypothetical protein